MATTEDIMTPARARQLIREYDSAARKVQGCLMELFECCDYPDDVDQRLDNAAQLAHVTAHIVTDLIPAIEKGR